MFSQESVPEGLLGRGNPGGMGGYPPWFLGPKGGVWKRGKEGIKSGVVLQASFIEWGHGMGAV